MLLLCAFSHCSGCLCNCFQGRFAEDAGCFQQKPQDGRPGVVGVAARGKLAGARLFAAGNTQIRGMAIAGRGGRRRCIVQKYLTVLEFVLSRAHTFSVLMGAFGLHFKILPTYVMMSRDTFDSSLSLPSLLVFLTSNLVFEY